MSARPRPFRLTSPVVAEDELHVSVAQLLRRVLLPPARWTCFPAGNVPLPPQYAAKLARFGLARGWPDILILFAGRIYGVELKRKGGGLSKSKTIRTRSGALRVLEGQEDVFPQLEQAGMRIAVCRDQDEVLVALRGWNMPMVRAQVAA